MDQNGREQRNDYGGAGPGYGGGMDPGYGGAGPGYGGGMDPGYGGMYPGQAPDTLKSGGRQEFDDNRRANRLCLLVILLGIFAAAVRGICMRLYDAIDSLHVWDMLSTASGIVSSLAGIAGLAVLIYVRIKYPANIFGKVLMWLLIVLFTVSLIITVLTLISCGYALNSCSGMG